MKEDEGVSSNEAFGLFIRDSSYCLYTCQLWQSTRSREQKEKLQVMTTFYPMYDFTKEVVGDEGEVELLIPAGTDSHDYEPSAKDMAKIQNADVFVYNNENMETWVPAIQNTLKEGMC